MDAFPIRVEFAGRPLDDFAACFASSGCPSAIPGAERSGGGMEDGCRENLLPQPGPGRKVDDTGRMGNPQGADSTRWISTNRLPTGRNGIRNLCSKPGIKALSCLKCIRPMAARQEAKQISSGQHAIGNQVPSRTIASPSNRSEQRGKIFMDDSPCRTCRCLLYYSKRFRGTSESALSRRSSFLFRLCRALKRRDSTLGMETESTEPISA